MKIKTSLLALSLITSISVASKAEDNIIDQASNINANSTFLELKQYCTKFEQLNKKSYNCDNLGKSDLLKAIRSGISDYSGNDKAKIISDLKTTFNIAQNYSDYATLCEKIKKFASSFPDCGINKISDCWDSSSEILSSTIKACISGPAPKVKYACSDIFYTTDSDGFTSLNISWSRLEKLGIKLNERAKSMFPEDEVSVSLFSDFDCTLSHLKNNSWSSSEKDLIRNVLSSDKDIVSDEYVTKCFKELDSEELEGCTPSSYSKSKKPNY